jgi:hypothetical protein
MKALLLVLMTIGWVGKCLADGSVYFIVGGPFEGPTNSFLLPLTNQADITKARKIVAARSTGWFPGVYDPKPGVWIQTGSDGTNRDVLAPGQPLWSWHVAGLQMWYSAQLFESPYSYPFQVERDVIAGTFQAGAPVSFLECGLIAELNPPFILYVENIQYPQGGPEHIFYWTYTDTNKVFNVEWTTTLSPPAWKALTPQIPGVTRQAPNVLDVPGYAVPNGGFFRLRADPKSSP